MTIQRNIGEVFEYKDQAGETHELIVVENCGDNGCYKCFFCWTKDGTLDERCVRTKEDKDQTGECSFENHCVYFVPVKDVWHWQTEKREKVARKITQTIAKYFNSIDLNHDIIDILDVAFDGDSEGDD